MEEKALVFGEVAIGVIVGFVLWSFVAPMLSSMTITPHA